MYFDWQQIERWSRQLGEAADDLDFADRSKPEFLDAGPFAALVTDMVEGTVAELAHLVLRLDAASDRLHQVARYYREVEETNQRHVEQFGGSLEPFVSLSRPTEQHDAWEVLPENEVG